MTWVQRPGATSSSAANDPQASQSVFSITEKATTTRAFSWLKAFTFKTLLRHYAKQKVDVKLGL